MKPTQSGCLALALLLVCLLCACQTSGPKEALNAMAKAMRGNDAPAFLSLLDMRSYASNRIRALAREDKALGTLDRLGRALGLGGMDDLLGNVLDMERELQQRFTRGVSTGELMAQCRKAETPDCPWVPEALQQARVTELGEDSAVAQVTTPARMTSWLALHRQNGVWRVVGRAVLESDARDFAEAAAQAASPRQKPAGGVTSL